MFRVGNNRRIITLGRAERIINGTIRRKILTQANSGCQGGSYHFCLLRRFPDAQRAFQFQINARFNTFLYVSTFCRLKDNVLTVLTLVGSISNKNSNASLIRMYLFATRIRTVAFRCFVPNVNVMKRKIRWRAIRIGGGNFRLSMKIPILFRVANSEIFRRLMS